MPTMLDKALIAARDSFCQSIDIRVAEEWQIAVKTEWKPMSGRNGEYVTKRLDGAAIGGALLSYISGLRTGWNELEAVLMRNQEKAGQGKRRW
jgi:hypothetical protein